MGQWLGQQVGTVGTNVVGNVDRAMVGLPSYAFNYLSDGQYPLISQNSWQATFERLNNPSASNTKLPPGTSAITGDLYTEAPVWMQGFYVSLQKAKARNPYFSDDLPPGLDFWGRPKTQGEGRTSEAYNPVRIQTGEYSALDEELIRLSEIGVGSFPFHRDRIDGVKLNSEQYNSYVTYINGMDGNGRMLGDAGFNPDGVLLSALNATVNSAEYGLLETDEEKFEELSGILADRRGYARKRMIKDDPDLNARFTLQQLSR